MNGNALALATNVRRSTGRSMTDLTCVELTFIKDRVERWIRFGHVADERRIDHHRRVVGFAPAGVFAFVRWTSNDYGTVDSRIDILQAVPPNQPYTTVPFVSPGASILLRLYGWPKVEQALQAIDAVERAGVDPAEACPDHWRHVMNRIAARDQPRPYTAMRHRAWLLRKALSA
jgi:hypothetical protein